MKTVPQAMELRNFILESFEKALLTNDLEGLDDGARERQPDDGKCDLK
jgi:hypothetical protein